jgi:hypothetical protein
MIKSGHLLHVYLIAGMQAIDQGLEFKVAKVVATVNVLLGPKLGDS